MSENKLAVVEEQAVPVPVVRSVGQAFDLAGAKERLAFLERRCEELERDSKTARCDEVVLRKDLAARQRRLEVGQITVDLVTSTASELREVQETAQHLQLALDAVKQEHVELKHRIEAEEARLEISRQEQASAALRQQREEAITAFVAGLAELLKPLAEAERIGEELGKQFPLAEAPKALSIDDLASRALAAWAPAGRYVEQATGYWLAPAMGKYIALVLRGPFGSEGELVRRLTGR